jgi:hypothetical protein
LKGPLATLKIWEGRRYKTLEEVNFPREYAITGYFLLSFEMPTKQALSMIQGPVHRKLEGIQHTIDRLTVPGEFFAGGFFIGMFLAKNAPAKNLPPNRKKLLGQEFSGEECS